MQTAFGAQSHLEAVPALPSPAKAVLAAAGRIHIPIVLPAASTPGGSSQILPSAGRPGAAGTGWKEPRQGCSDAEGRSQKIKWEQRHPQGRLALGFRNCVF